MGHGQALTEGFNTSFVPVFRIGDLLAADLEQGRSNIQALKVLYQKKFGAALLGLYWRK